MIATKTKPSSAVVAACPAAVICRRHGRQRLGVIPIRRALSKPVPMRRARHVRAIAMIVVRRGTAIVVDRRRQITVSVIARRVIVRAKPAHKLRAAKAARMVNTAAGRSPVRPLPRVVIARIRPVTANAMVNVEVLRATAGVTIIATAHRVVMRPAVTRRVVIVAPTVAVRPNAAMVRPATSNVLSVRATVAASVAVTARASR